MEALESSGGLSVEQRAGLDELVATLDDEYFRLQDEAADAEEFMVPFAKARAAAAIRFAGDDAPFEAATEAIYEAKAVTDDPDPLLAIVEAAMG